MTASIHILPNSSFMYHHAIRCYIVSILKASLNNLQKENTAVEFGNAHKMNQIPIMNLSYCFIGAIWTEFLPMRGQQYLKWGMIV
jgi:hypothetical protein